MFAFATEILLRENFSLKRFIYSREWKQKRMYCNQEKTDSFVILKECVEIKSIPHSLFVHRLTGATGRMVVFASVYIHIRFPQTQTLPEISPNKIIPYTFLIGIKRAVDTKN